MTLEMVLCQNDDVQLLSTVSSGPTRQPCLCLGSADDHAIRRLVVPPICY